MVFEPESAGESSRGDLRLENPRALSVGREEPRVDEVCVGETVGNNL